MQGGGAEQPAGERVAKLGRERENDRGKAWSRLQVLFFPSASGEMLHICC